MSVCVCVCVCASVTRHMCTHFRNGQGCYNCLALIVNRVDDCCHCTDVFGTSTSNTRGAGRTALHHI